MAIVSSVIVEDSAQRDGRRWIRERHTDQVGQRYEFPWMAAAAQDATAVMNARVASINAGLITNEVARNVSDVLANGSLASPALTYSTAAQSYAGLRAAYLNATRVDAVMIGDFLSSLTSGQLQTAFSMTSGQVTTLRTNKLTPAAALASSIRTSTGQ